MTVTPQEMERIAVLAGLSVDQQTLPDLTAQIGDILEYVAQLESVAAGEGPDMRSPDPARLPLRADVVDPISMRLTPREIAPEFIEDLFVVPRVGGLGGDA